MNDGVPTVADLGEIALVERIVAILQAEHDGQSMSSGREALVGPGDDAAVLPCRGNVVLTTDSQHEGVHFRRHWISPEMLGRRAIAVNASDLGAMGATPVAFLVSLALPGETPVDWVERLARGMGQAAGRLAATVVGGDVVRVARGVAINVTAVGEGDADVASVRRSGARAGDAVFVTGRPGRAAAGRLLLEAGCGPTNPTVDDGSGGGAHATGVPGMGLGEGGGAGTDPAKAAAVQACLRAFLDPSPPVLFGARAAPHVGAMMDVSDGMAIDLHRMCRASSVGALLHAEALLADPVLQVLAADFDIDVKECVLNGGDDYELLCAVGESEERGLHAAALAAGVEIRAVGRFVADPTRICLERDGRFEALSPDGWDHFAKCP